jgi:hypothetical protein
MVNGQPAEVERGSPRAISGRILAIATSTMMMTTTMMTTITTTTT